MSRRHPNLWKTWTPNEVSTLLRMCSEGTPLKVIAKQLGRTEGAVTARVKIERLSSKAQPAPSFSS